MGYCRRKGYQSKALDEPSRSLSLVFEVYFSFIRKHHKTGHEQTTFQTWQGRVRASGERVRGGAESRRGRDNVRQSAAERRSRPPMSSRSRPAATRTRLTASSHALRSLAQLEVRTELPDPLPFRAISVSESLTTYLVRDFE